MCGADDTNVVKEAVVTHANPPQLSIIPGEENQVNFIPIFIAGAGPFITIPHLFILRY